MLVSWSVHHFWFRVKCLYSSPLLSIYSRRLRYIIKSSGNSKQGDHGLRKFCQTTIGWIAMKFSTAINVYHRINNFGDPLSSSLAPSSGIISINIYIAVLSWKPNLYVLIKQHGTCVINNLGICLHQKDMTWTSCLHNYQNPCKADYLTA